MVNTVAAEAKGGSKGGFRQTPSLLPPSSFYHERSDRKGQGYRQDHLFRVTEFIIE